MSHLSIYSPVPSGVYSLYDAYTNALDALVEDFPDIKFAIATHTVDTVASRETHFNIEAKWYSETVIEEYTGVLPIFDLRDLESTMSNGSICQFECEGTVYRNLCPEYNMSGDTLHPDTKESTERLGKGVFVLLSKMFCEEQQTECTQDSDCDDNLACN